MIILKIIVLIIMFLQLLCAIILHGQTKTTKYNMFNEIIYQFIFILALNSVGFWEGGLK
jgi:hypothetical protein